MSKLPDIFHQYSWKGFPVSTTESYTVGADKTPTPPILPQVYQTLQKGTVSLLASTKQ